MKIIIVKPNAISKSKQKELKEAGYIVVETNNPDEVKVIDEFGDLDRDVLLSSALSALDYGNDGVARLAFGNLLRKAIVNKKNNP